MRARSMVVVAAVLASLFGPSSPASADTVQFTGTVTDFLTGAPVTAGGIVVARSPTTFDYAVGYINPDGTYAIPVADTSPHSLQAFANGDFVSQWARGHANFADADLITPPSVVDFAMHHLGVFQGTLTDQRGVPFVTAMVTVSTPLDGSAEVFTDANGHWSVNVSSAGLYTVGYSILDGVGQYAYGKASPETATQFRGGPDMNVTVDDRYLDKYRLPHIRGVLTDRRTGAPIMGASIEVYAANHLVFGDWAASGSTQPDGSYDIVVHPGAYKLDFGDEYGVYALTWYGNAGSPGKGKVLHVRQGVDATVNMALGRGATLTGTVLNQATTPLSGACPKPHYGMDKVAAFWMAPPRCSDGAGQYTVVGLFPGPYTVLLGYQGDPTASRWLYSASRQSAATAIQLRANQITAARTVRLPTPLG